MTEAAVAAAARTANHPDLWDKLWEAEGDETWRAAALGHVYDRIEFLVRPGAKVVDLGGGVGILGKKLADKGCAVSVWDHSARAMRGATDKGLDAHLVDLEGELLPDLDADVVVSTEAVEHLTAEARHRIFAMAAERGQALFSVPNDRLGPDEEPQHTVKYTAMSFKRDLQAHFKDVRVEAMGPYLLGVCGIPKDFKLSFTMPVRDEAADIERTLASFRGVADEIVIGIDPRTVDNTWEIAEKYADEVFFLDDPRCVEPESLKRMGLDQPEKVPENGVHFAWARNQCMDRCTGDYIFMSEGHEHLSEGMDMVLDLKRIMGEARVALVARRGQGQQWAFPWICVNSPSIRYKRATHNTLEYPGDTYMVSLPGIRTTHDRVHKRSAERAKQRASQNRLTLMDDWLQNQNVNSLFYLAQEWRGHDPKRAADYFTEFLCKSNNGVQKYQARLILAKEHMLRGDHKAAREVLMGATAEDWSRTEHWIWLGDLAYTENRLEEAYRFYRYAASGIGHEPFTLWWIDLCNYSYLPAQRLTAVCGELGSTEEAFMWARRVAELLPDDAPSEAVDEAQRIIALLREALDGTRTE